jgi:hypothetical protein
LIQINIKILEGKKIMAKKAKAPVIEFVVVDEPVVEIPVVVAEEKSAEIPVAVVKEKYAEISYKRVLFDECPIDIIEPITTHRGPGFRILIPPEYMERIRLKMERIKAVVPHDNWVDGKFVLPAGEISVPAPVAGEKWLVKIICKGQVVICLPIRKLS